MTDPSVDDLEIGSLDEAEPIETPTAWWVWPFLVGFVGGLGFLTYRLYPAHHERAAKPNFIDNIFANNLVLFAARLVLIAGAVVLAAMAVFVVLS